MSIEEQLVRAAKKTRASLHECGFLSAAVHLEWIKANSSPVEYDDYVETADQLILETVLSADPAALFLSDGVVYPFRSGFLRERFATRANSFGSASELSANPERRHLLELCVAEQRFSKMLERSNRADICAYSSYVSSLDSVKEKELDDFSSAVRDVTSQVDVTTGFATVVPQMMIAALRRQIRRGVVELSESVLSDEIGAVLLSSRPKILLQIVYDQRVDAGRICGSVCLKTYIRDEKFGKRSRHPEFNLMFYFRAVSEALDPYVTFRGLPELALNCLAWSAAVSLVVDEFRMSGLSAELAVPKGWELQDTKKPANPRV